MGTNLFTRNFGYTNSSNKLNSITIGANTYNYLYDNAGNLVQENSSRFFQWDAGNNMRCFYNQAGTSEPTVYAQYLYDAAGNRVKKIIRTQSGAYESVSYIGGLFDYKTNGTDDQTTSYVMDDTARIAMIRTGADFGDPTPAIKYNLEDHLGSSIVLLDTNGTPVNKEEYYPFGETSFGSYAKKRYRFSGKERDAESGLYYYGARYYLPMSCRFISVDPKAGNFPWQSSYTGFDNNPVNKIDPDGMEAEKPGAGADNGGNKGSEQPKNGNNKDPEGVELDTITIKTKGLPWKEVLKNRIKYKFNQALNATGKFLNKVGNNVKNFLKKLDDKVKSFSLKKEGTVPDGIAGTTGGKSIDPTTIQTKHKPDVVDFDWLISLLGGLRNGGGAKDIGTAKDLSDAIDKVRDFYNYYHSPANEKKVVTKYTKEVIINFWSELDLDSIIIYNKREDYFNQEYFYLIDSTHVREERKSYLKGQIRSYNVKDTMYKFK